MSDHYQCPTCGSHGHLQAISIAIQRTAFAARLGEMHDYGMTRDIDDVMIAMECTACGWYHGDEDLPNYILNREQFDPLEGLAGPIPVTVSPAERQATSLAGPAYQRQNIENPIMLEGDITEGSGSYADIIAAGASGPFRITGRIMPPVSLGTTPTSLPNTRSEPMPMEVLLTRSLWWMNPNTYKAEGILRRALLKELGNEPCTGICYCAQDEGPIDLNDGESCFGYWSGCDTCDENALTYLRGMDEYDICRACHWDKRCLLVSHACPDSGCEVYPQ